MYSEGNIIRPRKIQGWTQPNFSSPVFRIEDEFALALPLRSGSNPTRRNHTEVVKKFLKVVLRNVENYCDKSTLHGLKYIGDTSLSLVERIFWLLAFVSAFVFACYYISNIFDKWNSNPVLVAFNPTDATFNQIPFPSITICSMNQIKRVEAERILSEQNPVERQLLNDYCNFNNNSLETAVQSPNWETVQNFLIRVGQTCSDSIKSCIWQNDNISCEEYFNNDLTDEGLCCSFNRLPAENIFKNPDDYTYLNHTFPKRIYDWSPEKGFKDDNDGDMGTIPIRPSGSGTHLGLSIVVDAQTDNYFCSSTNSIGFKIVLSNPIETPKIQDYGFLVSPGVEARYVIQPEIREATRSLRSVDVGKRQCFFQDERPLRYFRSYTKRNCRLECQSNHTLRKCGCIPYYLPKNKKVLDCGKRDEKCASQAKEDMELIYGNGSSCNCLASCYEMNFETSATYSKLYQMSKNQRLENVTNEYFVKNMAVLHFFFKENRYRRQIKSEIYGFTEVLSNVGGLLGLCLGFSILSLIEICYYLSLKILCGFVQTRKKGHKSRGKNENLNNSVIPFMS
ncbi:pickpocket protein 28 isoform X2 [Tribolium castaneum]